MPKRFSRLKYALATLRTPTGTGTIPKAPAGTILAKYQEFDSNEVVLEYPRAEASKQEEIVKVSILPFYYGGVGSATPVKMSKRAKENGAVGTVLAAANQIVPNPETDKKLSRFQPAKAVVSISSATVTKSKPSQITGRVYDKRESESYTIPYGASPTEKSEAEVRKGIITATGNIARGHASFKPERYADSD